ncbi:hypothetical protein [Amaricoccus tamworthensis]|uniref:hypothetical protein n=1 Tax=Amaricoccus tamworthensis TaxID=57002 RepID=UPI003C7983DC
MKLLKPVAKTAPATEATTPFAERVMVLNADPYLIVADTHLRLISVFDDLRYDRSDLDMLCAPMRDRALRRLKPMGFSQKSGTVIENRAEDIRIHMPKFRALGASPFDALRDTDQRPQDYVLLTPTQTAARIIEGHDPDPAMDLLEALVARHPVNLLRIFDFLDSSPRHAAFKKPLGYLVHVQRQAIAKEPLKTRRALR